MASLLGHSCLLALCFLVPFTGRPLGPWTSSSRDADSQRIQFEFAEFAANSFAARIRCEFGLKFTVVRIRGEFALRIRRRRQNDHACAVFSPDENLTLNCGMQDFFLTSYNENYDDCALMNPFRCFRGACVLAFNKKFVVQFRTDRCVRLAALNTTVPSVPPKTPPVWRKKASRTLNFRLFFRLWTNKMCSPLPTLHFGTLLILLRSVHAEKSLSRGSKKSRFDSVL